MAQTTGFTVTTERLDKAAELIEDRTAKYDAYVQKLYAELDSMTSARWRGVASETFRERIEEYRDDFDRLKSILTLYAEILSTKAANYASTENTITSAAQNL